MIEIEISELKKIIDKVSKEMIRDEDGLKLYDPVTISAVVGNIFGAILDKAASIAYDNDVRDKTEETKIKDGMKLLYEEMKKIEELLLKKEDKINEQKNELPDESAGSK